jgi:acetyl-CoA carboxylase, biotin carboxylase subunit
MFPRILIANRGEIACRIARTCRRLGIETVAVFSEAEASALHVRAADTAVCIGSAALAESYLNIAAIIAAAQQTGAEAIHPGYGLLSEHPGFARSVAEAGMVFIGPSPQAMELMASKTRARAMMSEIGVPVAPGSAGDLAHDDDPLAISASLGYPVMVKSRDGGGGIGIAIVREPAQLQSVLDRARRSSLRAFSSDAVFLEKYIERARHIEVQLIGDTHGALLHVGDRECSVQRRHQKVTGEAPAPGLAPELRERIVTTALRAAAAVDYTNAGTVEFLLGADGDFYFLEMNTRLQVEHPVTEEVSGLDLVELQLRVAAGEPLPVRQTDVRFAGHAIECRIYAEDPHTHLPSPGTITVWAPPSGTDVRLETGVEAGTEVMQLYDPLLAKLITRGEDRHTALTRMHEALERFVVVGFKTNIPLLRRVVRHAEFVEGRYSTGLIPEIRAGN